MQKPNCSNEFMGRLRSVVLDNVRKKPDLIKDIETGTQYYRLFIVIWSKRMVQMVLVGIRVNPSDKRARICSFDGQSSFSMHRFDLFERIDKR